MEDEDKDDNSVNNYNHDSRMMLTLGIFYIGKNMIINGLKLKI